MKKWTKTTLGRIASGVLTEGEIRTMRIKLANAINRGDSASCTVDDADTILEHLEALPTQVSHDQARKGADWLHGQVFKKNGDVRATEFAQQFSEQDLQVIRDCHAAALPRFTLQGFHHSLEYQQWCQLSPIYRCYGADGAWFDYVARAWQSGGNSFITNRS